MGDLADRVTTKNKGMVSELPLTISAQDGLISQDEFFNKKVASKDLSSYLLLHHGDFAYNKSYSNGYPFGTIKRLEKYPQGVVSSLYIAFKPNSSISSDFMAQYYESNNWHKEIYKCAAEGARNHGLLNVPPSDFFATNLNIPITKSEQLKIGRLLNAVDQTITLHEEKKRQLERLKSALLQKMFADKSGYPPVRFEGFSDKWEQVKYGEIFQRRSKMGVSTPTLPSVEYDDINPGMGTLNKEPKSKGISKRGIYFNPGDVLFGKLRPYLKNWLFACFEGVAVGDFWVLTSSKIDHGFTYSLIQTPGFQYIANLSSGSKMPRSDWGLVSNARTFIPINHLEQERISSVLFGLDHAITLYEHKLEILNKIKSFLLQNMFI
ncbi:restriction endonuclease subunit S [Lactobacillus delbrueckii subsp. bulgaricus]